jgi:hypothetical protein
LKRLFDKAVISKMATPELPFHTDETTDHPDGDEKKAFLSWQGRMLTLISEYEQKDRKTEIKLSRLCNACVKLLWEMFEAKQPLYAGQNSPAKHLSSPKELKASSNSCNLCRLIFNTIIRSRPGQTDFGLTWYQVFIGRTPLQRVWGLKLYPSRDFNGSGKIRGYTNHGNNFHKQRQVTYGFY